VNRLYPQWEIIVADTCLCFISYGVTRSNCTGLDSRMVVDTRLDRMWKEVMVT
jgi:hypothetical protein